MRKPKLDTLLAGITEENRHGEFPEAGAPINELVGIVMKNSGGSANPETVEKVIKALRGERVSFVSLPPIADADQ